ncbi:MAG TPA: MFS transporter [Steroidobacteraceae bacterium]|nr:MFS transporter [Steroidobacteraceae bacterium]
MSDGRATGSNSAAALDAAPAAAAPRARSAHAAYLVGVLAAAYFLAFLDRQSLNLFAVPIQHDLHLGELELGLLLGFAFGAFYALLGIPFGFLADRVNRRRLVIAGVSCWSVATLVSALATSAPQLFIGRFGVGIGEATLAPAAASMIADAFPPSSRGRAFGVFALGTTFGSGAASLLGAGVIAAMADRALHLPLLGTLQAWQVTLLVVALAGIPIIAAMTAVREPPRIARASGPHIRPVLRYLGRHWPLYVLIYLTNVLASLMAYAFYPLLPKAMELTWHVSRQTIGVHLGLMIIVLSGVGIYLAGWLVDRFTERGLRHAFAIVGTVVFVILAAIAGVMFRMPGVELTWIVIGLYIFFVHIYFPFSLLALTVVTPLSAMASVSAINFTLTGLLGLSLGPLLVTLVSQHFFTGPTATGHAISAVCTSLALLGALAFALLIAPLKRFGPVAEL